MMYRIFSFLFQIRYYINLRTREEHRPKTNETMHTMTIRLQCIITVLINTIKHSIVMSSFDIKTLDMNIIIIIIIIISSSSSSSSCCCCCYYRVWL